MKITDKLNEAHKSPAGSAPTYSFEYFVPKTSQGVQNLYDRMDRMYGLGPAFVDITWNAGGRLSNLTCEIVETAQATLGLETCMHLTCTGMPREVVENALKQAHDASCQNILALRGDPPHESEKWTATEGGFSYAKDLVKYIRATYGDYFDIGVAGYPEGHPEEPDVDKLVGYLKEKVDAGATFVITQMFYDADNFINWVHKCRAAGITVPIIPGIMPISTYDSFMRRANWCQIQIPESFLKTLEPIKGDDAHVRDVGTKLVANMCEQIIDAGIKHLHFYTMNLEKSVVMVLEELKLVQDETPVETVATNALPWRQSLGRARREESVRPIFWKNRKHSYVSRTQDWDEFPNGRWGDSRSPAYGALETYGVLLRQPSAKAIKLWGHPTSSHDFGELIVHYLRGDVKSLPWSDSPVSNEIDSIKERLIALNERGIFTINSQPAVNGVRSTDPIHGWGPSNGYVYQKAYLELLVPPEVNAWLISKINAHNEDGIITYYSVNNDGDLLTNTPDECGPNAVTWGIYPGKEVIQPTIVEKISFLAWKEEAFRLTLEWSHCFPEGEAARKFLETVSKEWYLINIVFNDFQNEYGIFEIFDEK